MYRPGFRVVLVEDSAADAEILRMALRKHGADVELMRLENGADALAYFGVDHEPATDASRCDLVLLDLNLPKISGFEVLQRMRAAQHLRALPIVVLSGSTNPEEIARCHTLGATSYISKPSHLPELFAIVHRLLQMLPEFRLAAPLTMTP